MLQTLLVLSNILALGFAITVTLFASNSSGPFHRNGSLDAAQVTKHVHFIQCRYHRTRREDHLCRFHYGFAKRSRGHLELFQGGYAGTPVGELRFGGQPYLAIFDTAALFSTVDPSAYVPEASPTAEHIEQPYVNTLPDGPMSQLPRWRDVAYVGGIEARVTVSRAQHRIFDPAVTPAMGVCAMSRADGSSGGPRSVIQELVSARLLDRPVFAISLSNSQAEAGGGILLLGSYRSGLRFVPLDRSPRYTGLWAFSAWIHGIHSTMILDSGSSFIILPIELARTLFHRLWLTVEQHGSTLMASYPCAHPPVFPIATAFRTIILSRESLRFGSDKDGICALSIIGAEQAHTTLGLPFFRSAYVAFDLHGSVPRGNLPGRIGIGYP
ncbi:hypothetical protein V8E36_006634 [Tilletia maclaganii]